MFEIELNHCWKYFEYHANQRIVLFRYYVTFFVLFISGYSLMFTKFYCAGFTEEIVGTIASILLGIITYVFHNIDHRNRELIHLAEDGLRILENKIIDSNDLGDPCKVFNIEKEKGCSGMRHTQCFSWIFNTGYAMCVLLLVTTLFFLGYYSCNNGGYYLCNKENVQSNDSCKTK